MTFLKGSATSSPATSASNVANPSPHSADRFRLTGPSLTRDSRITAARRDIADIVLADRLFAPHYARADHRACGRNAAIVHVLPDGVAATQLLPGEVFAVLDICAGWAWGYCRHDGYVGYVRAETLHGPLVTPSHIVTARAALIFGMPDIKAPVAPSLPIGSLVGGTVNGDFLALDGGGFVHLRHRSPATDHDDDAATVACSFLGLPYLWGGRGGGGIDCSGLVQQALARTGVAAPRDSDQQRSALGAEIAAGEALRRNDILFFPGHVGIMVDPETIVHANAHWMAVTIEPLADVVARIAPTHERPVLSRRRLA